MITKKLWFFIFKSPNPLQNALTAISSDCPQCVCLIFCFCFFRPWNRSLSVLDMGCEASGRAVRGRQLHTTSFNEHAHAVGHADMFGFSAGLFVGPVFSTLHSVYPWKARKPRVLRAFSTILKFIRVYEKWWKMSISCWGIAALRKLKWFELFVYRIPVWSTCSNIWPAPLTPKCTGERPSRSLPAMVYWSFHAKWVSETGIFWNIEHGDVAKQDRAEPISFRAWQAHRCVTDLTSPLIRLVQGLYWWFMGNIRLISFDQLYQLYFNWLARFCSASRTCFHKCSTVVLVPSVLKPNWIHTACYIILCHPISRRQYLTTPTSKAVTSLGSKGESSPPTGSSSKMIPVRSVQDPPVKSTLVKSDLDPIYPKNATGGTTYLQDPNLWI